MSVFIEALYIFDEKRNCLLEHTYRARPPKPQDLISRYNSRPTPLPSIILLSDLKPPTTVYTIQHASLSIQCTSSVDINSLAALEFLRRVVDILEDFLGSPLVPHKIEENYEVIAQLLAEVCDGGVVCNTEPNALRESVEVSTRLGKLFETVGLQGNPSSSGPTNLAATLRANAAASGPAIPWRRANVRHTSNELYVDIVESLSVIFAPSGRPISARTNGSVMFTSKISGIPDLLLHLNAPGGTSSAKSSGIARTMQLPVFHPCVRLARWKENPGELSFIPPDGKFMLAGYEVDLLPYGLDTEQAPSRTERFFLPAVVDMKTQLGASGKEFEARVTLNNNFPGVAAPKVALGQGRGTTSAGAFSFGSSNAGSSTAPTLEAVSVSIPFPKDVKNIADFKPSRGDATFNMVEKTLEWRVPTKDGFTVNGTATLTGSVISGIVDPDEYDDEYGDEDADGSTQVDAEMESAIAKSKSIAGYYDDDNLPQATTGEYRAQGSSRIRKKNGVSRTSSQKLMPRSIAVSFVVKGWLPSGIKVESLMVDANKSRGLGEGVKPYKGVKYMTVSKRGVERRLH